MKQFILKRILVSILVLFGVSIMLYTLVRSMPSDYVTLSTASSTRITEEQRAQLRSIYGLDKPILAGYADWLKSAAKGDFGTSLIYAKPVSTVIAAALPITFSIALIALVLQVLIGVPLGALAARKRGTKIDYLITAFVFIGISLPSFFFANVLIGWFGPNGLNILPAFGLLSAKANYGDGFSLAKTWDYALHLVMPIAVFVITSVGSWLRYTRANMIEALSSDYVRTARAKGVPEHKVVYSHAFRNTLIPIVTLLGAQLPVLFSGSLITENLFALPGLGTIGLKAANMGDVPYLMAFNMLLAFFTVIGYLLSDILYAVVDPRVRLS